MAFTTLLTARKIMFIAIWTFPIIYMIPCDVGLGIVAHPANGTEFEIMLTTF